MRNNLIDPKGTVYLGNGGFGAKNIRKPVNSANKCYLEKTTAKSHFYLVEIQNERFEIQAIDSAGFVFDQISVIMP